MAKFYNVPVGNNFLKYLVNSIADNDTIIYVPTNRIAKALQDEIVKSNYYKPTIMPQIKVLGSDDQDDFLFNGGGEILSSVNKTYRRFWLGDLIKEYHEKQGEQISMAMALLSADTLAKLFDEMALYQVGISKLDEIDNEIGSDMAMHWQKNKGFISAIKPHWDNHLADKKLCDIGEYKYQSFKRLNEYIAQTKDNIIMAGFNPYYPILGEIMNTVASLENGMVIINGFDNENQNIEDSQNHPSYHIRKVVDKHNITVECIKSQTPHRQELINQVFLPAENTKDWKDSKLNEINYMGVDFIRGQNKMVEAMAIALKMRHNLETDEKTTALITADRNLARLVSNNLRRWNINIDDSSGVPLHLTSPAIFMRLIGQVVAEDFTPACLVDLFKHPLCYRGETRGVFLRTSRGLEMFVFRKSDGEITLNNLQDQIKQQQQSPYNHHSPYLKKCDDFITMVDKLKSDFAPLLDEIRKDKCDFNSIVLAHIKVAENIAGADNLWQGEDGNQLNIVMGDVLENASHISPANIKDYCAGFEQIISTASVRKAVGMHPRLYIWGLLEGRLQNVDSVIIGGMLDGIMPSSSNQSPFLSSAMTDKVGLPDFDLSVSLTAHDLISCLGAKEITFTMPINDDGKQSIPSRWWLRLEGVAKASGVYDKLFNHKNEYVKIAENIDGASEKDSVLLKIFEPQPAPPLDSRPDELSVTNIKTWYEDPYQTYAKHILKLFPVNDLSNDASPNINGNIIHQILEDFITEHNTTIPDNATEILQQMAIEQYSKYNNILEAQSVWLPRFLNALPELVAELKKSASETEKFQIEKRVDLAIKTKNKNIFAFSGKADRIDILKNGFKKVVDYKTGSKISVNKVKQGEEPQLGLIAYALSQQKSIKTSEVEYWYVGKQFENQIISDADLVKNAYNRLCEQVDLYANEKQPYYNENRNAKYNDYEHLFRENEWGVQGDVDETGGYDYK